MKPIYTEILLVGAGSFIGGVLRFLVSKGLFLITSTPFPIGTFTVNILGCFLIGFISSIPSTGLNDHTRLLLTTGFCGGFTTFSTFMNESVALTKSNHSMLMFGYIAVSLLLGFAAVLLGQHLAKNIL